MGSTKKALIFFPWNPFASKGGTQERLFQICRMLQGAGYDLDLVS